jgi:Hemerythrin HHE cation binding domain
LSTAPGLQSAEHFETASKLSGSARLVLSGHFPLLVPAGISSGRPVMSDRFASAASELDATGPLSPGRQRPATGPRTVDLVQLILTDHDRIGRLVGALDDAARDRRDTDARWPLAPVWRRLAALLVLHADAEEEITYQDIYGRHAGGLRRMREARANLDDIREAVAETRLHQIGSGCWWQAVSAARRAACDHISGQRGILLAFGEQDDPPAARQARPPVGCLPGRPHARRIPR